MKRLIHVDKIGLCCSLPRFQLSYVYFMIIYLHKGTCVIIFREPTATDGDREERLFVNHLYL